MDDPASSSNGDKLPDDVNKLLQVTKILSATTSQASSSALLGLCTSIVDRHVVDKLGKELEVICKKCGINSADTPMGYVLYGSVSGLQQAEALIHQSKQTKSDEGSVKSKTNESAEKVKGKRKPTSAGKDAASDISDISDVDGYGLDISPPDSPLEIISNKDRTHIKLDLSTAVELKESSPTSGKSTIYLKNKSQQIKKDCNPKPAKRAKQLTEEHKSPKTREAEVNTIVRKKKEPELFELDPVKIVARLLNKHETTITGCKTKEHSERGGNESMDDEYFEPEETVERMDEEPMDTKKESTTKLHAFNLDPSESGSNPDFHVCLKCSYYGHARLSLMRHMKRMHDSVLCDYCVESFDSAKDMTQHSWEQHAGESKPSLKRPKIAKKKPTHNMEQNKSKNKKLKTHIMEQNKSKNNKLKKCKMFKCCFCNIKLPTKKLVEMHIKKLHSEKFDEIKHDLQFDIVETDLSEDKCQDNQSLEDRNSGTEEDSDTIKMKQCPHCSLKSANPGAFKQHIEACKSREKVDRTTIKKRLTVDEMADIFEVPMELLEDMISDYPNLLKHKFKCDHCGYVSSKQGVSRHVLRTHSGPANIVCKYCHQRFRKEWELRSHQRSHFDRKGLLKVKTLKIDPKLVANENENSVDFQCDICTLHLSSPNLLEVHKIRHHCPEKGWQCLICELVFCEMTSLKPHVLSHFTQMRVNRDTEGNEDRKPKYTWRKESTCGSFLCEQCGTGFKTERTLKNHRIKCPTLTANYKVDYTEMGYNEELLLKAADMYPRVAKYTHPCPHCSYTSTLKGIEKHVTRSHRKMKFQCAHCPRQFAREWHVKEHLRISHRKIEINLDDTTRTSEGGSLAVKTPTTVTCPDCDFVCAKRGIAVHILYHKKDWNLRCIVCKKNLPSIEMMSQHLASHFNPNTGQLIMPKFGKGYSEGALEKYNKSVNIMFADEEEDGEPTPRLCEECGLSFASVTKLKHHMRCHESERANRFEMVNVEEEMVYECVCPGAICVSNCHETVNYRITQKYKCPYETCDSLHLKPRYVVKHIREAHPEEKGTVQCQFCSKQYSHAKNLRTHIRKDHYKELNHSCDICGKHFYDSSKLRYHMDTHLPKSERTDASACKVCGKVLVKKYLKQHMNSHTGRKPYKCTLCDRAFPYTTGLNRHMLHIHSNKFPYVCDVCGKAFKIAAKLKYHQTIHTGLSKHKCEPCQKVFTQLNSLKNHQQYHCIELEDSKRTLRLSSLLDSKEAGNKSEIDTTPAEEAQQVFMCSVCSITFTDYAEIEAHLSTHETKLEPFQQENLSQTTTLEEAIAPTETQNIPVLQEVALISDDLLPPQKTESTTYYTQSADGQETYLVASYQ